MNCPSSCDPAIRANVEQVMGRFLSGMAFLLGALVQSLTGMTAADSETLTQQFFRFTNGAPTRSHLTRGRYMGRDPDQGIRIEEMDDVFEDEGTPWDVSENEGDNPSDSDCKNATANEDDETEDDDEDVDQYELVPRTKKNVVSQGVKSKVIKSLVTDKLNIKTAPAGSKADDDGSSPPRTAAKMPPRKITKPKPAEIKKAGKNADAPAKVQRSPRGKAPAEQAQTIDPIPVPPQAKKTRSPRKALDLKGAAASRCSPRLNKRPGPDDSDDDFMEPPPAAHKRQRVQEPSNPAIDVKQYRRERKGVEKKGGVVRRRDDVNPAPVVSATVPPIGSDKADPSTVDVPPSGDAGAAQ